MAAHVPTRYAEYASGRRAGRRLAFAAVAAALALAPVRAAEPSPGPDTPVWQEDLRAARLDSLASGRPLVAFFYRTDDAASARMRDEVLASEVVSRTLSAFTPVAVDVDRSRDVADAYMIAVVPTLAVIESEDRTSESLGGLQRPETVAAFPPTASGVAATPSWRGA